MLKRLIGSAIGLLALALVVAVFAPSAPLWGQKGYAPAVKPPNQPPLASDPAVVTAISPNSPISVTVPADANLAQETGGNLAAAASTSAQTATASGQTAAATGTTADPAWTGTGTATVISALKGIYTHGAGGGGGSGGSVTQGTTPWVDNITEWANVSLGGPTTWGNAPTGTPVIGVNANVLASVLPTGAAQEVGGNLAAIAAAQSTLKAANTPPVATDLASVVSISPNSNTAKETGGNLAATAGSTATTATATSGINTATGTQADAAWTGTGNATIVAALKGIYNKTGGGGGGGGLVTQGTVPWSDNISQWNGVVVGSPTPWGSAPTGVVIGTNSNVLSSVLPANAAQETGGNLAAVAVSTNNTATATSNTAIATNNNATATGTTADAAWPGTGNGTVISVLKGIYTHGAGGGGGGGSVTQGTVPWVDNITQWNSVALGSPTSWGSAPTGAVIGTNANVLSSVLPTGAAQETGGNLATIAANTTTLANGLAPLGAHTTAQSPTVNIASDQATPIPVNITAGGAAAASSYHLLSAATTNSTNVKASAGTVFDVTIIQTTTTLGDFRFYDSAVAPTCSSATGVIANYAVQSNAITPGLHLVFPQGKKFTNGIGFCLTGAVADNDATAFVTGVQINISYQ